MLKISLVQRRPTTCLDADDSIDHIGREIKRRGKVVRIRLVVARQDNLPTAQVRPIGCPAQLHKAFAVCDSNFIDPDAPLLSDVILNDFRELPVCVQRGYGGVCRLIFGKH